MRKTRKRVFAAVLAAAMLFTTPGMAFVAAAEEAQTEDISESVTVQEETDARETTKELSASTAKDDTKECTCGTLCTQDSINGDCPVCGAEDADLSRCKGEKTENSSEEDSEYEDADTEECICGILCIEDSINGDCPVCGTEDADLSRCKGEKTEAPKRTQESRAEEKIITAWEWIDPEECLTDGVLALPGASRRNPAFLADVTALLPEKIRTEVETVNVAEDGEETETSSEALSEAEEMDITLTGWKCTNYPEDGAYEGVYTFYASLPEGFVLAEDAAALRVKVELGGAKMLDGEVSADYQEASWNGSAVTYTNKSADCTPVTDSAEAVTWNAGWYVVNSTVTISQPITVSGDVSLILADDCELNAEQGIVVSTGNSLNIYAQAGGTGTLNATGVASGGNASAGIGGTSDTPNSGAVTIHGGTINATGGSTGASSIGGAGIGGGTPSSGNGGSSGAITIYGGTVTANSGAGNYTGAGIGGGAGGNTNGNGGNASNITISGGSVNATGGSGGAGIGGGAGTSGNGGDGSNITISGGSVNATGGSGGAGIGGGGGFAGATSGAGTSITISGGKVTAVGGTYAAGIGGGGGYIFTNSYGITTTYIGGDGNGIKITDGIVDAQGGAGNSSGNYKGDPIGNGGNASGDAGVTRTAGIIFENHEGKVYGTVALDGEYTVKDGYTLTFAEGGKFDGNYAFYQNGSPIEMATVKEQGVAGPAMVRECTHPGDLQDNGNGTHGGDCLYCGAELAAASHTLGAGNICEGCNTPLVAKVKTSEGATIYLGEGDFAKAFDTYYNYNNVTITLLSDIQADSIQLGDTQASVHVLNTSTLDLAGHTITSSGTAIYIYPTGTLTIQDSSSGKTGQVVSTGGAAILTQTGMVSLTGGTYTGIPTIDGKASSTNVSSLLANYGTQGTPHYAYFNAQGNPIALGENQRELTGPVTVAECKHEGVEATPNNNGTHSLKCPYCGYTEAAEPCTYGTGYQHDNTNHWQTCTVCGYQKTEAHTLKLAVKANGTVITASDTCDCGYQKDLGTVTLTVLTKLTYNDGQTIAWKASDGLKLFNGAIKAEWRNESGGTEGGQKQYSTDTPIPVAWPVPDPNVYIPFSAGKHSLVITVDVSADSSLTPDRYASCTIPVTINPAELTADMVEPLASVSYNGTPQEPAISIMNGQLGEGTDYDYTYSSSDFTNAGAITITITGKGNYTGTVKTTYTIKKAPLTITASDQTITYGGSITQGAGNVTVAGLCTGDVLESITLTASTANVPGGNITPSAAGIKNSGGRDVTGNYEITYKEGGLTINKADADITVGTDTYNKTFGDAAFTLDVTDNNTEADVQYEVTGGTDVVSVSNGTVTIQNVGTATITVSLPASANYNAAEDKTITVNVAQKEADTVRELNRSYLYSRENADTIDLSELLPVDCGSVAYGKPQTSGAVAYSGQPAVDADGKLTYILKSGSADTEGTISVTVKTRNYKDISFTVKVKLTDRMSVRLKEGKEVTLKNSTLTYGEALSKLVFKPTVFVDDIGRTVNGKLTWKDAAAVPNAGTDSAVWVFTPSGGQYDPVEGMTAITVNKAVPGVSAVPKVEERVYNPSLALKDIALSGGAVTGVAGETLEGIWSWQHANVIPAVDNGGYEAVFTPEDVTNYETVVGTVTVTVTKAAPYIAVPPAAGDITYGDTLDRSRLSDGTVLHGDGVGQSGSGAGSTVPVAGTFTWEEPFARPVAADSNQTEYTVVFKPSDTVNYTTATGRITLVVDKAQYAPGMPNSAMDVPNVTGKVGDVSLPENWQWQEQDRDKPLIIGKTVSAAAVYTGADKGNYETETVTVAVTSVQVPDGLWISGLAPSVSYTGSAVKPVVKVYHGSTLLREKTDYTISYKNNTKAGTAQITVTGKGSYKGKATQTFTIEAVDLSVDPGISAAIATAVETGKNLKPAVTVTWNGKKLKEKTDYTLSYEANIKTASAEGYDVTITGKGNYTGVIVEKFHVTPNGTPLLNKATVKGLAKSYPYRENRMPEGLEAALENITVKVGKTTLAKEDYIVRLENVSAVGTGIVVIEAAPGSMYAGQKLVTFNITGASLKKGSIIGLEKAYPYTGSPVEPEVKVYSGQRGTGEQIPSDAYTVSYSNSVGNGKAKVTVTGIAAKGYSGSLSATYTISRLNIEDDGIDVEMFDTIEYAKGGAKPQPMITHTHDGKASVLREGVDYTLKYSNNTSAGGTKKPAVKITGTGNYCGTVTREYVITGQDISRLTITAADKAYNSKKKGSYYYSAPKVYDLNGKLLKSGTDYTVQYFDASTEQEIGKNDAVAQGAEIRVTVTGKGSYRGALSGTYRILAAGDVKDISKAKNDKITNQPYTGAGIQPEIRLYTMTGKTRTDLNADTDYEIIGFYNNIKKGTATVLIRGKGAYSGVKSITFKIVAVDNSTIWKGVF